MLHRPGAGDVLNYDEVIQYLELPEPEVRRLVNTGRLIGSRMRGRTCFRRSVVDAMPKHPKPDAQQS
jgi:hypothetical protein